MRDNEAVCERERERGKLAIESKGEEHSTTKTEVLRERVRRFRCFLKIEARYSFDISYEYSH